jgi:hypothetical protein
MGLGAINPKGKNIAFDLTIAIITQTSCIISIQMVFQIFLSYNSEYNDMHITSI